MNNTEKLPEERKHKDLKKIRSVIAKYKNRVVETSNISIEKQILKTLNIPFNKCDLKDKDKT